MLSTGWWTQAWAAPRRTMASAERGTTDVRAFPSERLRQGFALQKEAQRGFLHPEHPNSHARGISPSAGLRARRGPRLLMAEEQRGLSRSCQDIIRGHPRSGNPTNHRSTARPGTWAENLHFHGHTFRQQRGRASQGLSKTKAKYPTPVLNARG